MEFSKEQIISEIQRTGIVPAFFHQDAAVAKSVLESCYRGGLRVFEFTNRGENAHEVFLELTKFAEKFPDLIVGIGTIMNSAQAETFIKAGAKFVVSPILRIEIAPVCKMYNKPWIPGAATLTEIVTAKEAGAEVVKIFPASVLGPKFVSAILPVVSGLKLMPTGGVEPTVENLKAWFDAGVFCVGMGSQLFPKKMIVEKNWHELETKVKSVLEMVRQVRKDRGR